MPTKERIFGLDLLRAMAVLLVVFHHSLAYVDAPRWLVSFGWAGEIGVGALLVLSGYLIGQGLIRKSRDGRFSQFLHLAQFYSRRWWRTFPTYFFCLFVMAALCPPFFAQLAANKSYFLFLQNFAWDIPPFYPQTWTLALLEFFYLLFPLLLFLTSRITRNYLVCLFVPMAVLFVVPLVLKALHTQVENPVQFDQTFRKWVVFRLDTPIVGVAAALLQVEAPSLWAWFLQRNWIGLSTFSGVVTYHALGCPGLFTSHWLQVIFYPLCAVAMAPLLPFLCDWKSNRCMWGNVTSSVSQVSYSLYVSHFIAFIVGSWLLVMLGLPHDRGLLAYPLYVLLACFVTCGIYYLTEEPFIRLREGNARSILLFLPKYVRQIFKAPSVPENPVAPLAERPPG